MTVSFSSGTHDAISVIEYKGFELRSYSSQVFPTINDPYAGGAKEFSSIVRIDTIPPSNAGSRRYFTVSTGVVPSGVADALGRASHYGKNIIDSKIHPTPL